jgi:prepilin-type processing-associated H-X9-DG protein
MFPPGYARVVAPESASPATFWSYFILPHMEQTALHQNAPFVQSPNWTGGGYLTACQTSVPGFRCPSTTDQLTYASQGINSRVAISYAAVQTGDPGNPATANGWEWSAHLDDGGVAGAGFNHQPTNWLYRFTGAFGYNSKNSIASITDGTSNTAGISERYRIFEHADGTWTGSAGAGTHGTWAMGSPNVNNAAQIAIGSLGFPLNFNSNKLLTDEQNLSKTAGAFSSRHTGGVNTLLMDGSVRFLRDSTADLIRLALGSMNGGESAQGS